MARSWTVCVQMLVPMLVPMLSMALPMPAVAQIAPSTNAGEIRGRLVDSVTTAAVAHGSITVRRADSSFAGGTLPRPDGSFRVDGLIPGRYHVIVRVLGYRPVVHDAVVEEHASRVDLGVVSLVPLPRNLATQSVVAEHDPRALAPDRVTYDTRNLPAAAGGNTLEVLRTIPSVEVDGANRVTLRGSTNVVVQVSGRSTPLTGKQLGNFLAQLPANLVRSVEVATNPSAASDPEGTAGILNIVLDQKVEMRLSGALSAAASTTSQVNLSGNVGHQRGPFTLFLSTNGTRDDRLTSGTLVRQHIGAGMSPTTKARIAGTQNPRALGATLRSEWRRGEANALTFDGYLFGARYANDQGTTYIDYDDTAEIVGWFNQSIAQVSHAQSQNAILGFHRQRPSGAVKFDAEIEYWNNRNINDAQRAASTGPPDATGASSAESSPASALAPVEFNRTVQDFSYLTFKADHVTTFTTRTKLEAGLRRTDRRTDHDFVALPGDGASTDIASPLRATTLQFLESFTSGYAVVTQGLGPVQLQSGLRLEDFDTRLTIPTSSLQLDGGYRSAFPSAVVAWTVNPRHTARLSYARRVSRPAPGQLSPVEYHLDARTLSRGNPSLRPEYTESLELGFTQTHPWGSLQVAPYARFTDAAIRSIQFVDSNGVSVSTVGNVARVTTAGTDLNLTVRRGRLSLLTGGNAYHYRSNASNLSAEDFPMANTGAFSVQSFVWSTRANATWRLSPRLDGQVTGSYRAPYAIEGGSTLAAVALNAAATWRAWGDRGSIALRLSDPFRLATWGYRTANGSVVEYSERYNGARAVFLSVNRTFGRPVRLRSPGGGDGPPP